MLLQFNKLYQALTDPLIRFNFMNVHGFYRNMNDKDFISKCFKIKMDQEMNWEFPNTFNEKLQWLKLYDRNPLYTELADKLLVKKYVAKVIGENHVVPLIYAWDKPEDIDFNKLPNQFVLKCNHNSGLGMYICRDKSLLGKKDLKYIRKQLKKGLKQDYFLYNREWSYKNIKRKIICEQFMRDDSVYKYVGSIKTEGFIDYKFYCFNGTPKFLYIGFANIKNGKKHDLLTFLTLDWEIAPFYRKDHERLPLLPEKPKQFDTMVKYAAKLSKGIPFVRVDFFISNENIYFSEYTFYPGAGYGEFSPDEWEMRIGKWIVLPSSPGKFGEKQG